MDNTNQFILSTNIEESDWSPLFVFLYKASKDLRSISVMYPAGLDPACREEHANRFKNGWRSGVIVGVVKSHPMNQR